MKILVYGAGAVGGYLGAKLQQAGNAVTLVAPEVIAEAIENNGLFITEEDETIESHPVALSAIAQAFMVDDPNYDLIIMGMKSYDLASALDPLIAFCPDPPAIVTVQNGIGVERPLVEQFGAEKIVAGALTVPVSRDATNKLAVERAGRGLGLAPLKPGQNIKQWVSLFKDAGITTMGVADYRSMKWSKALLNIVGNATAAILNRPPGVVYKSNKMYELEVRMLKETLDVMEKLNLTVIDLPGSPATRLVTGVRRMPKFLLQPILSRIVAKGRGDKMPSFHIDLTSGKRKTEVIYHNGAIAQAGKANGVPTPINKALTDILWKLTREEIDWREFDGNPKRLLAEVNKYIRAAKGK